MSSGRSSPTWRTLAKIAEGELEALARCRERLEGLERDAEALLESYAGFLPGDLEALWL